MCLCVCARVRSVYARASEIERVFVDVCVSGVFLRHGTLARAIVILQALRAIRHLPGKSFRDVPLPHPRRRRQQMAGRGGVELIPNS